MDSILFLVLVFRGGPPESFLQRYMNSILFWCWSFAGGHLGLLPGAAHELPKEEARRTHRGVPEGWHGGGVRGREEEKHKVRLRRGLWERLPPRTKSAAVNHER